MPARVEALFLCWQRREAMKPVESATAIVNFGFEGDRHARPDSSRQVLLMNAETLSALGLDFGAVKENITTRGVPLASLLVGQQLQVGDEVELEVTKPCEPCGRMDEIRSGLQQALQGRRGILARVVRGGQVRRGDPVVLL